MIELAKCEDIREEVREFRDKDGLDHEVCEFVERIVAIVNKRCCPNLKS